MSWASAVIDCRLRLQEVPLSETLPYGRPGGGTSTAIGSTVGPCSPSQLGAWSLGVGVAQACVCSINVQEGPFR